ncbi:iron complex transport system substrate-binding protein [Mariniphaga anaerophila]|uniref:Iron complex transport system substrate-binding protein n=1 Tax=Mariniphaga anaerophila TaxID=1484053 RepID=A0A1M4XYI7_9BACT|nr:ABC transporter substrate-binding protein [Mariniphaga anaerophila]SHE98312.1 iron complex transport system substrate-binding protein [Mariniphaga anaerophila]
MRLTLYFFMLLVVSSGCKSPVRKNNPVGSNRYAHGFKIEKTKNITQLTVYNPWEKAENVSVEYFLVDKNAVVPDSLAGKTVIKTPVERVICLSTTHIGFLDVLDETAAVVGVSGKQYVSNSKIRARIENKEVPDVGYGQNLNYELMVSQKPDLVFVYGVGGDVTSYAQKLEELGVSVVYVAEYLEETPLGKAEWVKFFGAFFQKDEKAQQFFEQVEDEYNTLKKVAGEASENPKVLVGSPYKDSWWIPGGKSYLANLIADAGGDYLGKENSSHESYVISFEHALTWGGEADIWINMGNVTSKAEVLAIDQRFENFSVFNDGKLFNNVKRLGSHGGNDFWESGTVHPHWILHDLISIFHPGLVDTEMIYYEQLK